MRVVSGRHRAMMIVGAVALAVGALDPLEGSLILLPACVLVALAARWAGSRYERLSNVGLAVFFVGFVAMWAITAIGGVGGSTGRSAWWALPAVLVVPGWLLVVAGAVQALRETKGRRAGVSGRSAH